LIKVQFVSSFINPKMASTGVDLALG